MEARSALSGDHSQISQSYPEVIPNLSQTYPKEISMLSQSCLQLLSSWIQWEAKSALPRDHSKLSLSYPKVIPRLSQSYLKVVSELPQDNQLGSVVRPGLLCPGTTTSGFTVSKYRECAASNRPMPPT